MSADRWVRCPHCMADALAARAKREAGIEAMYGKVPVAEWKALADEVATPFDPSSLNDTVREDWELGLPYEADDASALIRYVARCMACGASAKVEMYEPFRRPA